MDAAPLAHARALLEERRVAEARSAFAQAKQAGADPSACDAGLWECGMLLGRWEDAWAASDAIEARQQVLGIAGENRFWDRKPLAGRRVMLRSLHGFGDALQFIRYAPRIRAQARSLCVEAHPAIVPLLRACDGVDQVITWDPAPPQPPAWDAQVEIMELPWIFCSTPATVPAAFPYLRAGKLEPSAATAAVAERIEQRRKQGRLQYGISWRSSNWNPLRSVPLKELAPALASAPRANAYSLQQDGGAELRETADLAIENIEAEFADLAVRMASLDVLVTVDGVLAHLAGALGKPALLLLPHAADWRWGLGSTTPWYPRMRLFRQQTPGNWSAPLAHVSQVLRQFRR